MTHDLARLCASHGIEPTYIGIDGREHAVPEETLAALAGIFGIEEPGTPPPGIAEAREERDPPQCHVPDNLRDARAWGLTCQLPSLASDRNLGMGDFADLAALCRLAAAEGADFLGLNPLNALFWSDPGRVSPFSPSNRRFLNPLYLTPEWIDGFDGLSPEQEHEAARLRAPALVDAQGVARLKQPLLRRLFERFPWNEQRRAAFVEFCKAGGDALESHALFEAISEVMVADGHWAGWPSWPEAFRERRGTEVEAFARTHRDRVEFHLWLQWQADAQLGRVQREAREAGMRLGLYLDFAVGASPDGSAAWTDPDLTVPGVSIGAPPDDFSAGGQDWGLAPLSPVRLAALDCRPFANTMAAVLRHAGALRIDHAMSVARLWLIPRGGPATHGAYVRYPLSALLARIAEASENNRAVVIGEDLGVVPHGFRDLMADRRFHSYKIFFFERTPSGYADPAEWPVDALACAATHDTPTFTGWWQGTDLDLRRDLGMLDAEGWEAEHASRERNRDAVRRILGRSGGATELSPLLHAHIASSPCRLVGLQIEDALGIAEQVNLPGTVDEHPNWRRRLPVTVDRIAEQPGFRAHVAAMRQARPR